MKKYLKNYDELSILFVLKKRLKLFIISLVICLICGSMLTKQQIESINNTIATNEANRNKELNLPTSLIKVQKSIPDNVIRDMFARAIKDSEISDYKLYVNNPGYYIYVIFYEDEIDIDEFINKMRENPVAKSMLSDTTSFITHLGNLDATLTFLDKRPVNKHYIYLDKNRQSQAEYATIASSDVFRMHTSLNSNKIWLFMIITSIMIALFITFGVESLANLNARLREKKHLDSILK
ncbi:hypothetical protein CCY99_01075 [Helicobacter sp. 16-1353]|uniref:hypothetical protein n=1 Tax=Helicobacter sp. 16-1353 TaxID=2004996 RepID=UPI000DCEFA5D|nr:hypothetical protein [Helicobacter sp. 16-1353]RAX55322.1 hypothetical protein CCY99_01075 [Helicobacter sp. 16-1353]